MTTARLHYERLLGEVLLWSVAAHGDPFAQGAALLQRLGLMDATRYLDLGAGFGAHAIALAEAGKQVTAVDFDPTLLEHLAQTAAARGVRVDGRASDLVSFLAADPGIGWDVIVCLGDTLTHLASIEDVQALLRRARERLVPGGRLVLGFRDSTQLSAEGTDRFLLVARDPQRSMHCLLEPLDDRRLRVTDIVTDVEADGPHTRIGDYLKLRIAPAEVTTWAEAAGLALETPPTMERGMTYLVFHRRQARPERG